MQTVNSWIVRCVYVLTAIVLATLPEIDPYSKLLLTASCEYDKVNGADTTASKFCPAYSDASRTPVAGRKRDKLEAMAAMFCSSCQYGDDICDTLFCEPNLLMVNIAMATIKTFCDAVKSAESDYFREYCIDADEGGTIDSLVCVPSPIMWSVPGMDQWCEENCNHGYTDTCTDTMCICTSTEADQLTEDCEEFAPTSQYDGVEGMVAWCQESCSAGHCPAGHCRCAGDREMADDQRVHTGQHSDTGAGNSTPRATQATTAYNLTGDGGLEVVSSLVCEHAFIYQQQELVQKYCGADTEAAAEKGYGQEILDQVEQFAPQLLCALTSSSSRADTCGHMFCGDSSESGGMIRSAMCSLCQQLDDIIGRECHEAYC